MKLHTRLIISFFLIVFVPVILAGLAFCAIRFAQANELAAQPQINISDLGLSMNFSQMKVLFMDMAFCIILILVFTALAITWWIYKGIVAPIHKLEEAAQNIKEGNLDFTVEVENDDEIGRLFQNFEEMRQRLKESAEEKLESEKENRILVSNISHDLKTPITAIKGYVEGEKSALPPPWSCRI